MNQRQKKKSSQHRKRHFDGLKAKEGHSTGAQKHHPNKEQEKTHNSSTGAGTSAAPQASNKVRDGGGDVVAKKKESDVKNEEQKRTFSRRKIVSNWAKYDEERLEELDSTLLQESEEALQDRLLQLFNLPITHTTPSLADIEAESSLTDSTRDSSNNFLTLDCRALAEALSTLPLHQQLDIDLELLQQEEEEKEIKMFSQSSLSSSHASPLDVANCGSSASSVDGDTAGGSGLDFSQSLKRISTKDDERKIEFSSLQTSKETSSLTGQLPTSAPPGFSGATVVSDVGERDQLDRLLRQPAIHTQTKTHGSPVAREMEQPLRQQLQSKEEDRFVLTSPKAAGKSPPPVAATVTVDEETQELDDMLDELLA